MGRPVALAHATPTEERAKLIAAHLALLCHLLAQAGHDLRDHDRDAHEANVPRLIVENGSVRVSYERRPGALYSRETPGGPSATPVPPTATLPPLTPTPTPCGFSFSDVAPSDDFYPAVRAVSRRIDDAEAGHAHMRMLMEAVQAAEQ